jgi:hypothetical protein
MSSKLDDTTQLLTLAAIGVGVYLVVQALNAVQNAANNAINAGQNLDANLGLTNFDSAVSSLFSPPAGS